MMNIAPHVLRLQLCQLSPGEFEEIVYGLVTEERRDALRIGAKDLGVDILVPSERWALQCKRYTRNIAWQKCRSSIERASTAYELDRYTFVFPLDLSGARALRFVEELVEPTTRIAVDAWTLTDLRNRLVLYPRWTRLLGGSAPLGSEADPRPLVSPRFAGRDETLAVLRAQLVKGGRAVLFGVGGSGKSQAAAAYERLFADEYIYRWWVAAHDRGSILAGARRIARDLELDQGCLADTVVMDAVAAALARLDEPWLLIFDDAALPEEITQLLPPRHGHVLVTTLNPDWRALGIEAQRLPPLSAESAYRLLRERSGRSDAGLVDLAEDLERLPLALEQVGAFLEQTPTMSVAVYRRLFGQRAGELLARGRAFGYAHTVAAAWTISIEGAEALVPAARELIGLLSHLDPREVPLDVFANERAGVLADELVLAEALGALRRFSLVDADVGGPSVSMHRLVQTVVRHASPEHAIGWALRAADLIWDAIPEVQHHVESWPAMARVADHALTVAEHASDHRGGAHRASMLLSAVGNYLRTKGRFHAARDLFQRALELGLDARTHQDQRQLCVRFNNYAGASAEVGDLSMATTMHSRSLRLREQLYGPDHPDTIRAVGNLAGVLADSGRFEEALPLAWRAWEVRKRLEPDDPDRGWGAHDLAEVLLANGHPEDALPLADEAVSILSGSQASRGDESWALELRASIRIKLGDPESARDDARRALAQRQMAGEDNLDAARAWLVCGEASAAIGEPGLARQEISTALRLMEAELDVAHPDRVRAQDMIRAISAGDSA